MRVGPWSNFNGPLPKWMLQNVPGALFWFAPFQRKRTRSLSPKG